MLSNFDHREPALGAHRRMAENLSAVLPRTRRPATVNCAPAESAAAKSLAEARPSASTRSQKQALASGSDSSATLHSKCQQLFPIWLQVRSNHAQHDISAFRTSIVEEWSNES